MMFPCLGIFLLLILILTLAINRSDHAQKEVNTDFWNRENRSNTIRKQDISTLDYIALPFDQFPMGQYPDEELISIEEELRILSKEKILNLCGLSNTDLKLKYGPANLNFLCECDDRCSHLFLLLERYSQRLLSLDHVDDAVTVAEYAVSIHSDVADTYLTLADLYQQKGEVLKISQLIGSIDHFDNIRKKTLNDKLHTLLKPSVL